MAGSATELKLEAPTMTDAGPLAEPTAAEVAAPEPFEMTEVPISTAEANVAPETARPETAAAEAEAIGAQAPAAGVPPSTSLAASQPPELGTVEPSAPTGEATAGTRKRSRPRKPSSPREAGAKPRAPRQSRKAVTLESAEPTHANPDEIGGTTPAVSADVNASSEAEMTSSAEGASTFPEGEDAQ
jgi:hypothetical protein